MELVLLGLSLLGNLVLLYLLEKPQIQTSFNKLESTVVTEIAALKAKLEGAQVVVNATIATDTANVEKAVDVAKGQVAQVEKAVSDASATVETAVKTGVDEVKQSV